ncbi:transcriptional regulator, AraC family [Kribbella flavida DSM 17836]|uniref:Transcriptional regulator, AraC family n=1 Tax=Kribbella flavida (strain DSM 17836 / JCM 10339 / NBRC 14399) TaxID=479435 RepID=D2Q0X6_KRIFD|nr:AraC family transcriptional regulator [Kribbella flavida]ADB35677.1 transcriptional regulator, AraC family [Kribbella flavida DSM 17836]
MDDALSRLLDDVRPQGVVVETADLSAPWQVRCPAGAALTLVTMVRGTAVLTVDGETPAELAAGDVALVVGRRPYTLADGPAESADQAVLVTGSYEVGGGVCDRVLGGLPPVLLVESGAGVGRAVDLLTDELENARPGQRALLDRLLDLIVLTALRVWLDRPDSSAPPWYRAQQDPAIGSALALMHAEPARRWTVAELAASSSMSRAAFSRRFHALVGEPPMSYLTCWRLCLAGDLLRGTDDTLATVARKVGYANGYALSAAFTRFYGVRPGEYRTDAA